MQERTELLAMTELAWETRKELDRRLARWIAEDVLTEIFGSPEGSS